MLKKLPKLTGLISAPFTAFTEKNEVNLSAIKLQAQALIADGVKGAYICGSTGEGISCSVAERIAIMEAWKEYSEGKLILIAHTGALALQDCKELSVQAQKIGYDAFSVVPANFFKPTSVKSLAEYCAEVASYAKDLPFYYYHTIKAEVPLVMRDFLGEVDGKIENFAGIKFNHHNLYDYQNCLNFKDGKYDIVFGVDEFFAAALAIGAKGFIGSTYNYSAKLYLDVWESYKNHDEEKTLKLMKKVCECIDILVEEGGLAAGKALMLLKNIDCGKARLPNMQIEKSDREKITEKLKTILEN